ncbi:hypothetical protein VCR15J5_570010 [Vibrio crassostreae]|nr:hypothetical protein VCR15J5_570010 [Vibrio crassostreae]
MYKHSCFMEAGYKSCGEEKKREMKNLWLLRLDWMLRVEYCRCIG